MLNSPENPTRRVDDIVAGLGCLQIDAIRVVRRSHELALLARGATLDDVGQLHYGREARFFETWGHAHSLMHISLWPALAWRRRQIAANGWHGSDVDRDAVRRVLSQIEQQGPCTWTDLGPAHGRGWERSSPARQACEWLLSIGELVCVNRNDRWQRIYALPDQALPPALLSDLPDHDGVCELVRISMRALGIATARDVADYFRMSMHKTTQVLNDLDYEQVAVDGSTLIWYLDPAAGQQPVDDSRVAAVSPLDSLVWTRPRQTELFGRDYRLESYKPPSQRAFGYFGMPLVCGSTIVGRVAARRSGAVLRLENLESDRDVDTGLFETLAGWAECQTWEPSP